MPNRKRRHSKRRIQHAPRAMIIPPPAFTECRTATNEAAAPSLSALRFLQGSGSVTPSRSLAESYFGSFSRGTWAGVHMTLPSMPRGRRAPAPEGR